MYNFSFAYWDQTQKREMDIKLNAPSAVDAMAMFEKNWTNGTTYGGDHRKIPSYKVTCNHQLI